MMTMTTPTKTTPATEAHAIRINHEGPTKSPGFSFGGGHRAHCSCGWWSDCYAQLSDTQRAVEVHLRRSKREDFDGLIARSSIGAAIADIKKRGIDAHLVDLERELHPRRPRKAKRATGKKLSPEDAAFRRGFALALATIWRCHHDGQMVERLLRENSLNLTDFRGLDIEVDCEMIRQALDSRRKC
jgi:hypothetical protein